MNVTRLAQPIARPGPRRRVPAFRVGAVAALAYVLCDVSHEVAHLAATALPLGVTAVSISTIGLGTIGSSAVVAAAGPAVNLALGASLPLASVRSSLPTWRYFCWLFGSINLFNASAYLVYSSILGSGDWAVALGAFDASVWRPLGAALGLVSYAGSIHAAQRGLLQLVASQVVRHDEVDARCTVSYWMGGLVVTLGSVLNPVGWLFILSSGVATGFGAMVGLLVLPALVRRHTSDSRPDSGSLQIATPWVVAGIVATMLFIGVLGPGIRIAPAP